MPKHKKKRTSREEDYTNNNDWGLEVLIDARELLIQYFERLSKYQKRRVYSALSSMFKKHADEIVATWIVESATGDAYTLTGTIKDAVSKFKPNTNDSPRTISSTEIFKHDAFKMSLWYDLLNVQKNMSTNLKWLPFPEAQEYIKSLNGQDSDLVKNYTYNWDDIYNAYLRDNMDKFFFFKDLPSETDKKYEEYFYKQKQTTMFSKYFPGAKTLTKHIEQKIRKDIYRLQNIINGFELPRTTVVYRGVEIKEKSSLKNGDIITEQGFLSTSVDQRTALSFTNVNFGPKCCMFKITIPAGMKALPVMQHSHFPSEKEILLPAGTSFKVLKKLDDDKMGKYEVLVVKQERGLPLKRPGVIKQESSDISHINDYALKNQSWTPELKERHVQYETQLEEIQHKQKKYKKIFYKIMKAYASSSVPSGLSTRIKINDDPTLYINSHD
jgi:hypothetical protein